MASYAAILSIATIEWARVERFGGFGARSTSLRNFK
jgi:hypothetical protein